jgi:hypothetical protein
VAPEDARPGDGRRAEREGAAADVSAEGVDLTLIREWLGKSPAERLALADAAARELESLRAHVVARPASS